MTNQYHHRSFVEIPRPVRAYKYDVIPDDPTTQALTAQDLRDCLKIDIDSLSDATVNNFIFTAQQWAMNYAGFILFKSAVTSFRNEFPDIGFELRRYPILVSEPVTVSYSIDQVFTTVSTDVYLVAQRSFYSALFLKDGEFWPVDGDIQADSVKLTFFAGFGDDSTSLPFDIIAGIKALAIYLFENPGDCNSCAAGLKAFPSEAAKILGFRKPLKV